MERAGAVLGVGETGWIPPHMRLFTKTFRLKAVDWLNLSRGAGIHIFDGHIGEGLEGEEKENQVEAWEAILLAFHMVAAVTCNVDGQKHTPAEAQRYKCTLTLHIITFSHRQRTTTPTHTACASMRDFRNKIITLLAIFEREIPAIFMHAYPHTLIHMPAQIFRWGSARNIWCFFLERCVLPHACTYIQASLTCVHLVSTVVRLHVGHLLSSCMHRFVGWCKGFITGRNQTATCFINAYTRLTFLRRMHPAMRQLYISRVLIATFAGAMGQFLRPYSDYVDGGTHTTEHTRTSTLTNTHTHTQT